MQNDNLYGYFSKVKSNVISCDCYLHQFSKQNKLTVHNTDLHIADTIVINCNDSKKKLIIGDYISIIQPIFRIFLKRFTLLGCYCYSPQSRDQKEKSTQNTEFQVVRLEWQFK